ncbi:MAG: hypothetical protein JOZ14_05040 [Acidobacteria bacterium]|nr:hypothetical protein [Acidobacteriota bacterium]
MSSVTVNSVPLVAPEVAQTIHQRSIGVGILFGVVSLVTALVPQTREQFFHSYLLGFMLWLGVALGSMAILMIQHLTGGWWGMVIRRQLEAAMKTLPLMALLFIPIVLGRHHLYVWTHPDVVAREPHLRDITSSYLRIGGSPGYLFLNGYIGRAVVYFAVWLGLAFLLERWSREQDSPPVQNLSPRFRTVAAPGLILYAFSISFAVIDWVMSLDPYWISTIYGFIFIVGECLSALCFMVIVERILVRYQPMASLLKPKEVHDHGKLILTFVLLWAYFSFSQLLIIWAGNLPMEIRFFTRRLNSGWQAIGLALVIFHFGVPFLLLLSRALKRDVRTLVWLASWLIFMRFVDLYWYIEPSFHKTVYLHPLDFLVPIAIGGFWLALFFHNLRLRPLLPVYDMHGQEFLEYVGASHA